MKLTITQYDATTGVFAVGAALATISIAVPGSIPPAVGIALTLNWGGGAPVGAGTYVFAATAPYPFTIASVDAGVGSNGGTVTATVRNAGAAVSGLTAMAINLVNKTRFTASGANAVVAAGAMIDLVISITGAPADSYLTLNGVR